MANSSPPGQVRARAYLVGLGAVALVCLLVGYSELVVSRTGSIDSIILGASQMPAGAVGGLIALLMVNRVLRRLAPSWQLQPAECAVIYIMMICAALLSSFGLTALLIPSLVGVNYYAGPQNQWKETFYGHIPQWMVPFDTKGPEQQFVARAYYEGLRPGESLPWSSWLIPLGAWTLLALLLFFLMACLATLVRRPWMDNERLTFPLVQLPLQLIQEGAAGQSRGSWLFRFGALLPFLFHTMNGLHNLMPGLPGVRVFAHLHELLPNKPWTDILNNPISFTFAVVGFAYFLPLDVSFSMWFFVLFFRAQEIIGVYLGHQYDMVPLYPSFVFTAYQATGAAVAISLSMLWLARPHWKLVWERARYGRHEGLDANEMMSYRWAFWGAILSIFLIVLWCCLAGMNPLVAVFMVVTFLLFIIFVMTRCASEIGLLMLHGGFRPMDLWAVGATKASLGVANLTPLAFLNAVFLRDTRILMPVYLDGAKLFKELRAHPSRLTLAVVVAIPPTILLAYGIHLWIAYRYGAIGLNAWFFRANPVLYFEETRNLLLSNAKFDIRAPSFFAAGFLFTLFLIFMRARFWWWPFHPLGYFVGDTWPGLVYWFSFFIGWLVKGLIVRYGGLRVFLLLRPFFLGLILGEFGTAILWAALSAIFGLSAPAIPIV